MRISLGRKQKQNTATGIRDDPLQRIDDSNNSGNQSINQSIVSPTVLEGTTTITTNHHGPCHYSQ